MSNRLAEIARRKQLLIGVAKETDKSLPPPSAEFGRPWALEHWAVTGVSALLVSGYGGKLTKPVGAITESGASHPGPYGRGGLRVGNESNPKAVRYTETARCS